MPTIPFLPAVLRRTESAPAVPGDPARIAADLAELVAEKAELAEQLRKARLLLDDSDAARRIAQLERQLDDAWAAQKRAADDLREEHRIAVELRKDRDGLRKQLDRALGYDADDLHAIETGDGQPHKA